MTEEQLARCKAFLDYFSVDYSGDVVYMTSGGNSVICNPNSQWKDFGGYSINSIARAVAEQLNKKVEYRD